MEAEKQSLNGGDLLFAIQVILSWIFSVPQVIRSYQTTAGMTITWPLSCAIFVLINLFLALGAYRESRSRKALQVLIVYANGFVIWVAILIPTCLYGMWLRSDTVITTLIVLAVGTVLTIRKDGSLKETFFEPITRGLVSMIVKGTPQLFMAYRIVDVGRSDGLAGATLIIGHVLVCLRIAETYLTGKQDGWTPKNKGILLSELGNELTWCATTVAWIVYNN